MRLPGYYKIAMPRDHDISWGLRLPGSGNEEFPGYHARRAHGPSREDNRHASRSMSSMPPPAPL